MDDYRIIKRLSAIMAYPLTDAEKAEHAKGVDVAIGIGGEGRPDQLDILYRKDRTLVFPIGSNIEPFSFKGRLSPEDCKTWFIEQVLS